MTEIQLVNSICKLFNKIKDRPFKNGLTKLLKRGDYTGVRVIAPNILKVFLTTNEISKFKELITKLEENDY